MLLVLLALLGGVPATTSIPLMACGDVPVEKAVLPFALCEPLVGGDPIGPKSGWVFEERAVGRGADVGKGPGEDVPFDFGSISRAGVESREELEGKTFGGDCLPWAGAVASWTPASSKSSGRPNDANGGAGADGERVALRGMAIGGRPEGLGEVGTRVGAVEPPARRGFLLLGVPVPDAVLDAPCPSRFALLPPRPPFPSRPRSDLSFRSEWPAAASWAAFLFFLSIAMDWPGRIWASAHLWPNLQLPLTNHAQVSF